MFTNVDVSSTTVGARRRATAGLAHTARGTAGARRDAMNCLAWLVACAAGICSGVIAGVQPRATAGSILAIAAILAIAIGVLTRLLARAAPIAPSRA